MNRKKTFIYLIPKNCISGHQICSEKFIVDELTNLGHKIIQIKKFYTPEVKKILKSHSVDAVIFNSLRVIWKNQKIFRIAKKVGIKIYWWYFDTAMSKPKRARKVNKIAPQVDIFFNKDKGESQRYRKLGVNPIWLDQGVESVCDFVETEEHEFDLGFIGSLSRVHQKRTSILKKLDEKYNLVIYTPDEKKFKKIGFKNVNPPIFHAEFGKVASKTKIMLNLSVNYTQPYCWSNRIHLLLGSGAFCISEFLEGIEESYTNEKDCLFFHNLDELYQLIDKWLTDDLKEERERIRYQGFLTAHKNHSYKNRIIEFLNYLNA